MVNLDWQTDSCQLEKILGFIIECPRCRSWDLSFQNLPRDLSVKCKRCGLEIVVNKKSLIHGKQITLPIIP